MVRLKALAKREKEKVIVRCYCKSERWERGNAIEAYVNAIKHSEGSERNRYVNVLIALLEGADYCSDINFWD